MSQKFRQPEGGRIDRGEPLSFTFDGQTYEGYRGDTVASALLANGVHLVGRSFKYHRPRGIVSAGVEEPNALIDCNVTEAEKGTREANNRATVTELRQGLTTKSVNAFPRSASIWARSTRCWRGSSRRGSTTRPFSSARVSGTA